MARLNVAFLLFCLFGFVMYTQGDDGSGDTKGAEAREERKVSFQERHDLYELLNLIAKRLLIARKVAISKYQNNQPVEDLAREKVVLEQVVELAEASNLDKAWSQTFFKDQIEGNKIIQQALIDRWTNGEAKPPKEKVNLVTEVRPIIDQINRQMIEKAASTVTLRNFGKCSHTVESLLKTIKNFYTIFKTDQAYSQALKRATSNVCE